MQATDIFLAATLVRELGGDGSPPLTADLRALLATATADDPERRPTAAALWRLARDKITQPRLAELARGRDVPWRRPDELHGLIGERVALTSLGDPPPSDRPAETPVGGERDLRTALPHDLERFRSLLSGSDGEA